MPEIRYRINAHRTECRTDDGKLHNETGPAVVWGDGVREWWRNNKRHRDDGPAIASPEGWEEWYCDGRLHRLDGPAYVDSRGEERWYNRSILHRLDGPAAITCTGVHWYVRGVHITFDLLSFFEEYGMTDADDEAKLMLLRMKGVIP